MSACGSRRLEFQRMDEILGDGGVAGFLANDAIGPGTFCDEASPNVPGPGDEVGVSIEDLFLSWPEDRDQFAPIQSNDAHAFLLLEERKVQTEENYKILRAEASKIEGDFIAEKIAEAEKARKERERQLLELENQRRESERKEAEKKALIKRQEEEAKAKAAQQIAEQEERDRAAMAALKHSPTMGESPPNPSPGGLPPSSPSTGGLPPSPPAMIAKAAMQILAEKEVAFIDQSESPLKLVVKELRSTLNKTSATMDQIKSSSYSTLSILEKVKGGNPAELGIDRTPAFSEEEIATLTNALPYAMKESAPLRWACSKASEMILDIAENQLLAQPKSIWSFALLLQCLERESPAFRDVLGAAFVRRCCYVVPHFYQKPSAMSMETFQELRGQMPGEDEGNFFRRMAIIVKLHLARLVVKNEAGAVWTYFAKFLNLKPRRITPSVVLAVVEIAGAFLLEKYGRQYKKTLLLLQTELLPKLVAIRDGARTNKNAVTADLTAVLSQLESIIDEFAKSGVMKPPDGFSVLRHQAEVSEET